MTFTNDLWLHFALDGSPARALRALIGVSILSAAVSFSLLLNPRSRVPDMPDEEDMSDVQRIVRQSTWASSHLALIRDKRILFHPTHQAFVMFRIARRSWVSFGDPVGEREDADELAWAFRDLAVRHGSWPVFYQVREGSLRRYVDMGLAVVRLGEEARVDLSRFAPEAPGREATAIEQDPAARAYMEAIEDSDFVHDLVDSRLQLEWSATQMVCDDPAKGLERDKGEASITHQLERIIGKPQKSLDLVSAYFVPTKSGVEALTELARKGVKIRILTNSLEATDVSVVHAGYAKWRKELLQSGITLYELRRQPSSTNKKRKAAENSEDPVRVCMPKPFQSITRLSTLARSTSIHAPRG